MDAKMVLSRITGFVCIVLHHRLNVIWSIGPVGGGGNCGKQYFPKVVCALCFVVVGALSAPARNQRMIRRDWKLNFFHFVTRGFAGCGPVIALELRAASRRRRTYLLRMAYVAALTLYVAMVWVAVVSSVDSQGAFTRSRMAAAGISVGCGVMWFLILAGPAAAILLTTNCFQEELHHGGLALILGTPLGYSQIVAGRFIGRLAQMLVLLLAALPSLALARVFGGVPLSFVIGGVLLALGSSAVAASQTMLYSVESDHPYQIVFRAAVMTFMLNFPAWMAASNGASELAGGGGNFWPVAWMVLAGVQVMVVLWSLARCTRLLMVRGRVTLGSIPDPAKHVHNVAGPAGRSDVAERALGRLAERRSANVRAAMASAGVATVDGGGIPRGSGRAKPPPVPRQATGHTIPWPLAIKGSPIIWRGIRRSFLYERKTRWLVVGILLGYVLITGFSTQSLTSPTAHRFVLCGALGVYAALLAVASAGLITSEKRGRCWQLLLTTPLTDWDILWAKVRLAVWKASLPIQAAGIYVAVLTAIGAISPIMALNWAMMVVAVTAWVLGLGLLCSTVFRRTTTAMMLCLGCLFGLWVLGPELGVVVRDVLVKAFGMSPNLSPVAEVANPFCLVWVSAPSADAGHMGDRIAGYGGYRLAGMAMSAWMFVRTVAGVTMAYTVVGLALAWMAKRRFRRVKA